MARFLNVAAALTLVSVIIPVAASAEVSEERRELTRQECDIHARFAELAIGLKQKDIPLKDALELFRGKFEGEPLKVFETIIIDAYSYPSVPNIDATADFKVFAMKNCFMRAEIEGRY